MKSISTDVVVIGGGIMGCGTARLLSKAGKRVVILERDQIGRGASGANAGGVQLLTLPPTLIPYALEACKLWQAMSDELGVDIEYHQTGGLRIAESTEDLKILELEVPELKQSGLQCELITGVEARKLEPCLSQDITGAIWSPIDGHANSRIAVLATAIHAQRNGCMLLTNQPVIEIKIISNVRYIVQSPDFEVEAGLVIDTAGAWSAQVASLLNVPLWIQPVPLQMQVTNPQPQFLQHLLMHARRNLTIKQYKEGNVIIGGGRKGEGGLDKATQRPILNTTIVNLSAAVRVFPRLAYAQLIRAWAGMDCRSPDLLPCLGILNELPGFFVIAGFKGGFTLSSIWTKLLTELILTGSTSMPITAFSPNRPAAHRKFLPSTETSDVYTGDPEYQDHWSLQDVRI